MVDSERVIQVWIPRQITDVYQSSFAANRKGWSAMDESSDQDSSVRRLPEARARLSRRSLLRWASAFGAAPVVAGLLAACGGSSSSTSSASTASTSTASATSATATSSAATASASPGAATASASPGASPAASGSPSGSPIAVASTSAPEPIPYKVEQVGHQGGRIVYGDTLNIRTFNPLIINDGGSQSAAGMMFDSLTQLHPKDGSPLPQLAASWEISTDGITYTFTMQDGVKWHDGQPFSAADAKFTYDLFLNPDTNSPRTSTLAGAIKSVSAPDDGHLVFTLKGPNASFLTNDTFYGIVPQHILKDVPPKQIAQHDFSRGKKGVTIGQGPFMFDSFVESDHCTLVKNPNYWQGAPAIDTWIHKYMSSSTILTQQLKTGEVDYGGVQPADYADMQKQSNLKVTAYDTSSFTFYGYQMDPKKTSVFQEKVVRQALLYAVDRAAILKSIYFGLGVVAVGTEPPVSWAYAPDQIKLKYPYDPAKAKSMLDDAGWKPGSDGIRVKNGKRLSFKISTASSINTFVETATVLQQEWKEIGVEATPNTIEWNAFIDLISTSYNFDMYLVGLGHNPDPDQTSNWACSAHPGGFNAMSYCNPQLDKLMQQALETTDRSKRKALYVQMQNIIMDDCPVGLILFSRAVTAYNKRFHNYFPNTWNTTFDVTKWWVEG